MRARARTRSRTGYRRQPSRFPSTRGSTRHVRPPSAGGQIKLVGPRGAHSRHSGSHGLTSHALEPLAEARLPRMMSHATFICLSLRSLIRRSSSRFARSGCQVWRSVLTIFLSISSPSSGLAPSTCSASFLVEGSQPLSSVLRTPDTDGRGRRGSEGKRVDDLDVASRRARDPSMRSSWCVNANHIAEMRSIATSPNQILSAEIL